MLSISVVTERRSLEGWGVILLEILLLFYSQIKHLTNAHGLAYPRNSFTFAQRGYVKAGYEFCYQHSFMKSLINANTVVH